MANSRYQNGKIYKITAGNGDGPCYVGSTCTKYLAARLCGHQAGLKRWKAGKRSYVSSFDLLEQGEVEITLIELFPTRSLDELKARERYWIERLDCVNKNIPGRTAAEYHADHRETIRARKRAWYIDHREEHIAKCLNYSKQHREDINANARKRVECLMCGMEVNRNSIHRHKKRKHSGSSSCSSTEPAAVCVEVASSSASTEAPPI